MDAKQELGLNDCHSTNENHLHAHLSLLFVAESLVRFAQWKYNKKAGIEEKVTHGQVVDLLFHTRCEALLSGKRDSIQVYFDTAIKQYASFINEYCPRHLTMAWFDMQLTWDDFPLSG